MSGLSLFFNYVGQRFNKVVDKTQQNIQSFGNNFKSTSYALRQEVPFERWFYDHDFANPIKDPQDLMKARLWAVFAVLEGAFRIVAEVVSILYLRVFQSDDKKEVKRHLNILDIQSQSIQLSLLAIVSPNEAKKKARDSEGNLITGTPQVRNWGTLYLGKVNIPHL